MFDAGPIIRHVRMRYLVVLYFFCFFFFNDTATTEIYTLSLHDALPICGAVPSADRHSRTTPPAPSACRSEEHTSELQSRLHLVCRLLLEKKNKIVHHGEPTTCRHLPPPKKLHAARGRSGRDRVCTSLATTGSSRLSTLFSFVFLKTRPPPISPPFPYPPPF